MSSNLTAFFAYQSSPDSAPDHEETIQNSIKLINRANIVNIRGWRDHNVTGRVVIEEVCGAIDNSQLFMCDITYLSPNVLFELGYAIAKNKKIWICLNGSYDFAKKDLKRIGVLSNVGYETYENSQELNNKFFQKEPYNDLNSTLFNDIMPAARINISGSSDNKILYLKSEIKTDSSIRLSSILKDSNFGLIIDDYQEVGSQPLSWYAQAIYDTNAIVAHLIDENRDRSSKYLQNAKYCIICGIAYGLGKPVLMLAHAPYIPPVDFRNILQVHTTANQCVNLANSWLLSIEHILQEYSNQRQENIREVENDTLLKSIDLGQYVAENESIRLLDYFLPTAAYYNALKVSRALLYIGRRGSGKTANLLRIEEKLKNDVRNHVCVITPGDFEFDSILQFFGSGIAGTDKTYFTQNLWQFLVYAQLATSVYEDLMIKSSDRILSHEELNFISYVEKNSDLILKDFAIKMENIAHRLSNINLSSSEGNHFAKITEALHGEIISHIRALLGEVLAGKQKVHILVDNLDKAWDRKNDLETLARFILGLISVSDTIAKDFHKTGTSWKRVDLSIILFLRSDIFSFIQSVANEGDKIAYEKINWDDEQLLYKIIEERIVKSLRGHISATQIWETFFARNINGKPVKKFIYEIIIPRPRDMIFLCKFALTNAVNRGHTRIEEDDLFRAVKDYSNYAFASLLTETVPQFRDIERYLYEFVGLQAIVTKEDLFEIARRAEITDDLHNKAIDILIDATFLGIEVRSDQFEFIYESNNKRVNQKLAQILAQNQGVERYKIHPAFHDYLSIEKEY